MPSPTSPNAGQPVHHPSGAAAPSRDDIGFLLAKASQRWNELLARAFDRAGYPEVRPAYGSVLVPLFEQNGLRMGELARRSRLSKQTMTQLVRRLERDGLVRRVVDADDRRATTVFLTDRSARFRPVATQTLAELERAVRLTLGEATDDVRLALQALSDLEVSA